MRRRLGVGAPAAASTAQSAVADSSGLNERPVLTSGTRLNGFVPGFQCDKPLLLFGMLLLVDANPPKLDDPELTVELLVGESLDERLHEGL